jgi:hypothetical protein
MKVKFGARCLGMNDADEEIFEFDDDVTEKELEESLRDFAIRATSFESWFYKCDDKGNEII